MTIKPKVFECFSIAKKEEEKGKKHKGLLFVGRDNQKAEEYVQKAKVNLGLCELYKKQRMDYKIPEEWFYSQYYCALAILAKFGVESRSQKCTALFLRYVKDNGLIDYDDEFIERIMVYKEKEEETDVDEREKARYGSSVQSEEIIGKYYFMMDVCRRCISACEELVFSEKKLEVSGELLK